MDFKEQIAASLAPHAGMDAETLAHVFARDEIR